MKKTLLATLLFTSLLTGCSSWIYGESNEPEPQALPVVASQFQTQVLWRHKLGDSGTEKGFVLNPASDGKNVYAVSADGKFYSFDVRSGQQNYRVDLDNDISSGVTVIGNFAFIGTQNGDLMALDVSDGTVVWRVSLSSMLVSRPAFGDGFLAVYTPDGELSAYKPQDGSLLWRYHLNEPNLLMRGNASPVVGGGVVMITSDSGQFVVVDGKNGLPIAKHRVATSNNSNIVQKMIDQDATPKVNNGRLFASAYQSMVYAIELQQGKVLWKNIDVNTKQDFSMSPDALFITASDGDVVALNQMTGQEIWRNGELKTRRLSPPLAIPGRIGVLDYEGHLSWLDERQGKLIAQQKIGGAGSHSEALVLSDTIVWQLNNGTLVAIRPQ